MKILKPVCLFALLLFLMPGATSASAQQQPQEGVQQFADLGNVKLQNGSVIFDFRVCYRTLGRLNADKSNAILWPTWLGGTSQDLLEFIGPGKVLDSSKYFVVLVDAIGNGVSTSPSNSKTQPLMNRSWLTRKPPKYVLASASRFPGTQRLPNQQRDCIPTARVYDDH